MGNSEPYEENRKIAKKIPKDIFLIHKKHSKDIWKFYVGSLQLYEEREKTQKNTWILYYWH